MSPRDCCSQRCGTDLRIREMKRALSNSTWWLLAVGVAGALMIAGFVNLFFEAVPLTTSLGQFMVAALIIGLYLRSLRRFEAIMSALDEAESKANGLPNIASLRCTIISSSEQQPRKMYMPNRNEQFLSVISSEAKELILGSIATHYGITPEAAYAEVTNVAAEDLLDYMVEPQRSAALVLMQMHRMA